MDSLEKFLQSVPSPEVVAESEFTALYDLVESVINSALYEGLDPQETLGLVVSALDEVIGWARQLRDNAAAILRERG